MATSAATISYLLPRLKGAGEITAKKMFGEYGLYLNGKMVALVCDDLLYIKPTAPGLAYWPSLEEGSPYPGAKPCLMIQDAEMSQEARVVELLQITWDALPLPKPRKKKA